MEVKAPPGYTRDGDQFELFVPTEVEAPWGGKSARVLTKVAQLFSLGAPPAGGLRDLFDPPA